MPRARGPSKPVFATVFATSAYEPDGEGVLRAVLPSHCVFATGVGRCSLRVDHYRHRKTGPRFPLAVVGCSAHPDRRYTLYPPGHFPYGREAAVPCSPTGGLLKEGATGRPRWEVSVFAAALEAAEGERWSCGSPWDDARRRRTQGRRLELAGRLLGVHGGLEEGVRERIATRLGVATLKLRAAAREWARNWTLRGAAVVAVLGALPVEASALDRILATGALAGLWAPPRRWDPLRRTWVGPRSGGAERGRSSRPRGRDPPPTNLPAPGRGGPM